MITELQRRLLVWLRADEGVHKSDGGTGRLSFWASAPVGKDQEKKEEGPVFKPLEGERRAEAERAWREAIRRDRVVAAEKGGHGQDDGGQQASSSRMAPPEGEQQEEEKEKKEAAVLER